MIRGTTPTVQFTLPINPSILECLYITFAQKGAVVVEKCLTDCECDGEEVTCRLTQGDTLALNCKRPVDVQVRLKTVNGDAIASQIYTIPAGRILKEGEI